MKNKMIYLSPSINVEELVKADVLLASNVNENNPDNGQMSLLDLDSWWD